MRDLLDDEGLGLTEIVVSMFMLALLAIAFLPVLITGVKSSESNAVLATATQLANQALDEVRPAGMNCTTFPEAYDLPSATRPERLVTDGRGGQLRVTRSVRCVPADGEPERVTVRVFQVGSNVELATATTFVRVG